MKFAVGLVSIVILPSVNGVVPHAFVTSNFTSKLVAGQLLRMYEYLKMGRLVEFEGLAELK